MKPFFKKGDKPSPEKGGFSFGKDRIRQSGMLVFTCAECGKTREYRFGEHPFKAFGNSKYCLRCWERVSKEMFFPCKGCGKEVSQYESEHEPYADISSLYGGGPVCRDCRIKELAAVRDIYGSYEKMLTDFLKNRGKAPEESSISGIDKLGRPTGIHIPKLGENEMVISFIPAGDGKYALIRQGFLRCVRPPRDERISKLAERIGEPPHVYPSPYPYNDTLAAVWAEGELYVLEEKGTVCSTDKSADGERLFEPMENFRRIAVRVFGAERVAQEIAELRKPGMHELYSGWHYSGTLKIFYLLHAHGGYHDDDYTVDEIPLSREKIRERIVKLKKPVSFEICCLAGEFPRYAFIDELEEYKPQKK
ncbi:MAG: hypothetical protein IJ737_00060 [Ruminococcus sp.]|nr:hypothetical protein [Ruminococcus sp.]